MGLLDDYSGQSGILGIGMSPRPTAKHQEIIKKIIINLDKIFDEKYFLILPESAVDLNNLNSKAPDIVIYKKAKNINNSKCILFIEITSHDEYKKILKKAKDLMNQYKILESFVYNYEDKEFYKLTDFNDSKSPKSDSDILNINLYDIIKKSLK
jgi:hypothetical protein